MSAAWVSRVELWVAPLLLDRLSTPFVRLFAAQLLFQLDEKSVMSICGPGQGRKYVLRFPIGKRIAHEAGDIRNLNDLEGS